MKARNIGIIIITLSLLIASCSQYHILYSISKETAPRDPRIEGAPTNMVVFEREYSGGKVPIMFVASGRLHWYANAQWDSSVYAIPQPGGKISALAVTDGGKRLYALCRSGNDVSATLRYLETDGTDWENVSAGTSEIQTIYADPDGERLFAGTGRINHSILYVDTASAPHKLKTLKGVTSLLSGVAYHQGRGDYYLSTRGGMFKIAESDLDLAEPEPEVKEIFNRTDTDQKTHRMFMSMIKLDPDTIIAVERSGGALYAINDDDYTRMRTIDENSVSAGNYATGAIALWENSNWKLLCVGIQDTLFSTTTSSHTYGYVEFVLKDTDDGIGISNRNSSSSMKSVDDSDRYTASLGTKPVNHLFQTPPEIDEKRTFFASTQTTGLWSYRDRPDNGGWQWNAEE